MDTMAKILVCLLLSLFTSRLSAGDFDPYTDGPAESVGLKAQTQFSAVRTGENVVDVISAPASWDQLVNAVMARPTQVQTIQQGVTTYKIYTVTTRLPLAGQQCQNGTAPYNSIFISKPTEGPGNDIYPVRISLVCRDEAGIKDSLYIDADINGWIIDAAIYNGSLGVITHPLNEKPTGQAGKYSLDTFLRKTVKHFTAVASGN